MALSTTEGEYMAMLDGAKEAIWFKDLACNLSIELKTVKMYFDNQSAGPYLKVKVFSVGQNT